MLDLLMSFAKVLAAMGGILAMSIIGRKAAAAYVATIIAGAILCGCVVNFIIDASSAVEAACCASHGLTALHWTCAAFLAVMMVYNLIRPVGMSKRAKHPASRK